MRDFLKNPPIKLSNGIARKYYVVVLLANWRLTEKLLATTSISNELIPIVGSYFQGRRFGDDTKNGAKQYVDCGDAPPSPLTMYRYT